VVELTRQRQAHGWTRTELGRRARLHPARVGAIENGRAVPAPESVELQRLAVALGIPRASAGTLLDEAGHIEVVSP
jgi:transcriptional regulator with XRE-family HTH domain